MSKQITVATSVRDMVQSAKDAVSGSTLDGRVSGQWLRGVLETATEWGEFPTFNIEFRESCTYEHWSAEIDYWKVDKITSPTRLIVWAIKSNGSRWVIGKLVGDNDYTEYRHEPITEEPTAGAFVRL